MKIYLAIMMLIILSALFIISENNIKIQEDASMLKTEYTNWFDKIYSNMIHITGEVVKLDWSPKSNI